MRAEEISHERLDELVSDVKRLVLIVGAAADSLQQMKTEILREFMRFTATPPGDDAATLEEVCACLKRAELQTHRVIEQLSELIEGTQGPRTLRTLQAEVGEWQRRNFPQQPPGQPALGTAEETGELWEAALELLGLGKLSALVGRVCHAELKLEQRIRGTREELRARLEDAIGDLVVFIANLCNTRGIDLQEVVDRTWSQVSKRDWRSDPVSGGAGA